MAIASGMTCAITSPLHAEMLQAVKAADVLMGNDPHCAAWIRGEPRPRRGGGRRGGPGDGHGGERGAGRRRTSDRGAVP